MTQGPEDDALLSAIVAIWNNDDPGALSLTLTVPGATVTGDLVGHAGWWEAVGELGSTWQGVAMAALGKPDPEDEPDEVPGEEPRPDDEADVQQAVGPFFIHLKNARWVAGPGLLPENPEIPGFLWRGRLQQVSSWAIGSLGISQRD